MPDHKIKSTWRLIIVRIILILVVIFSIEGMARLFLYITRGRSTIGLTERKQYLKYQPFVMFGPERDKELTVSNYPKTDGQMTAYRILLIGGSTAGRFPKHLLEAAFHKKFPRYKFEVIKAASGGYNARQELIVAAIWGPDLEPDMIISLDGATDLIHRLRMKNAGTFYLNQEYALALKQPFLSPFVHVLRYSQLANGITRLKVRMEIGPVDRYTDAIPVYVSAQHSINMLTKGMSAARIMVLQPFRAFKDPLSKAEANFRHFRYREPVIKEMFDLLDKELKVLAEGDNVVYVDGRDAFNGIRKTIFSDDVHFVSDDAYRILAEYIVGFATEEIIE